MNDIARESLLYDFYGNLLTDKKRSVMECYHEDDMSLGEIADEMGISRAAVHDSLKSAEAQLEQYEEKLGLLAKYEKAGELADEADAIIKSIERLSSEHADTESPGIRSKISGADEAAATGTTGSAESAAAGSGESAAAGSAESAAAGSAGTAVSGCGADLKRLRDIIAELAEPGS